MSGAARRRAILTGEVLKLERSLGSDQVETIVRGSVTAVLRYAVSGETRWMQRRFSLRVRSVTVW